MVLLFKAGKSKDSKDHSDKVICMAAPGSGRTMSCNVQNAVYERSSCPQYTEAGVDDIAVDVQAAMTYSNPRRATSSRLDPS